MPIRHITLDVKPGTHLPRHRGSIVHVSGLDERATKEELAEMFQMYGFDNCNFYWRPTTNGKEHNRWCWVQFATSIKADSARFHPGLKTFKLWG